MREGVRAGGEGGPEREAWTLEVECGELARRGQGGAFRDLENTPLSPFSPSKLKVRTY